MKFQRAPFLLVLLSVVILSMTAVMAAGDDGPSAQDLINERLKRRLSRNLHGDDEVNLQRVKEHDQRRMKKMQELIEERTAQLKAHEAGHRRLSDEDHERFTRQIKAFKRKIDQVNSMTDEEYDSSMTEMARSIKQMNQMGMPDL